ncbi:MAG: hypothetical protein COT18_00290 [Elusimicrobia bacterium CG08_land_8_20_14_0_20_59_10]|nr:MAG: hypothetical protein COT18_00290 [Elusimicrobia bacterium CG08_land_8_20_14_0_20_59_10]
MNPALIPLVYIFGFFATVAVLLVLLVKKQGKTQAGFFDKLGVLGASGAGTARELTFSGRRIRTQYRPRSRNSPSLLSLLTEVPSSGTFSLTAQSAAETFMQKLGLETDVETGDPGFDPRFDVDSDDSDFAVAYFASPKKREAVQALFALGCSAIHLEEGGLHADWTPFEIKEDTPAEFIGSALPHLAALCEELPAFASMRPMGGLSKKNFRIFCGVLLALSFLLFVSFLIFAGKLQPLDSLKLFLDSLRYSLSAWLLFVVITALLLKGKTWFFSGLLQFAAVCVVLFPLLGYCGGVWFNAVLDDSKPAVHRAQVLYKSSHRNRSSTTYYVRVRSWRHPGGVERLAVPGAVYRQVQLQRDFAVVETKPGYFGYEYVTKASFVTSLRSSLFNIVYKPVPRKNIP